MSLCVPVVFFTFSVFAADLVIPEHDRYKHRRLM